MRTIVDVLRESTGQLSQFIGLYNFGIYLFELEDASLIYTAHDPLHNFGIYLFELEDASLIYTAMTLSKGFRTVDCT